MTINSKLFVINKLDYGTLYAHYDQVYSFIKNHLMLEKERGLQ